LIGAGRHERAGERRTWRNGYRDRSLDPRLGTLNLKIPKLRTGAYFPGFLEPRKTVEKAVVSVIQEAWIAGVSIRRVDELVQAMGMSGISKSSVSKLCKYIDDRVNAFLRRPLDGEWPYLWLDASYLKVCKGGRIVSVAAIVAVAVNTEGLSSTQVGRAAKHLDAELEQWRKRPLGEVRYLILDARYERMRHDGIVRDVAVLSAIGVGPDERRRVLGVSIALSEAEVHWRAFLDSLVARGLRGAEFIVSDDHAGLRAARRAVFGGAKWQRCQFHLAQNAIHHAPNAQIRARIGSELRQIWNQPALAKAGAALAELVASYQACAPKLAAWLEQSVPEGLAVFSLPESHQKRMRTSNPIERSVQQEVKRRTVKVRVFPSEDSMLRLVSAILVEIDEKWAGQHQPHIKWDHQNA
jgi:transposase-like protein